MKIDKNTIVLASDDNRAWYEGKFIKKTTNMKGYSNIVRFPDGSECAFKYVKIK